MAPKSRRQFLHESYLLGSTFACSPVHNWSFMDTRFFSNREEISKKLVEINDEKIEALIDKQIDKPNDRWNGGLMNGYQIPNAHSTASFLVTLSNSYTCPHSRYYKSPTLVSPLIKAANCLLNVQHSDGSIDLYSTNFHSTPDTAFIVNDLAPVFKNLTRLNQSEIQPLISYLEAFLQNTGNCLTIGGIHTPNHRWVVSAALAWINHFFPDQRYVERIDEWLSEGVDQDPDGQFTEQSVSIYSPICDTMFLTMGKLLDRPPLLDIVRKNLEMSLYYIQPGGEVLTDASGRQDKARTGFLHGYYYTYRYFAILDQNPEFAAVCQLIESQMPNRITRFLAYLMEDPIFEESLPTPSHIPDNYFKRFSHSGLFRIRRGLVDLSIIEDNPTFFAYRKGKAVLQSIRLHAAFYGDKGQFKAEEIITEGHKIILKRSITHGYFQPFPIEKRTGDGDWEKMPREERAMSEVQTLHYQVTISESEGNVNMEVLVTGVDYIPLALEWSFRKGGKLSGVIQNIQSEDTYFLEEGTGKYVLGNDTISFGPGIGQHQWAQIRGMLPKQEGHSVYFTAFTPFKHTFKISSS